MTLTNPSDDYALAVSGLQRTYITGRRRKRAEVKALRGVDLCIAPGEVHGLLGPNGAGKTTLCKILSTILLPTAGSARVLGHDVVQDAQAVRRLIGLVLGGDRGLYTKLTATANLEFWAAMYGIEAREAPRVIAGILERVGLSDAQMRVDRYSRGMKQRLHLARGLMAKPLVLLLDEPTLGMDPVSAKSFRELVSEVQQQGTTVLLTTHDMAEAEAVCDRVSLIDDGALLATESPAALGRLITTFERVDVTGVDASAARQLEQRYAGMDTVASARALADGRVRIETKQKGALADIIRDLVDAGHTGIQTGSPSLTEVYTHIIGDRGMAL